MILTYPMKYSSLLIYWLLGLSSAYAQEALFSIDVSKSQVWQHDSYIVEASFCIEKNALKQYQFHEMHIQHPKLVRSLRPPEAWIHNNVYKQIFNLPTSYVTVNNTEYVKYTFIKMGISPVTSDTIRIPSLPFTLAKVDTIGNLVDTLVLHSKAHTITVKPLPDHIREEVYSRDRYYMVGNFRIENADQLLSQSYRVGDTIEYRFTLVGRGTGYPIHLPEVPDGLATILVDSVTCKDRVKFSALRTQKTFYLKIIPLRKGILNFGDLIRWPYFSIQDETVKEVYLDRTLRIIDEIKSKSSEQILSLRKKADYETVIVLDVSESMIVEDYYPNRFSVAKSIANHLLQYEYMPLILFAGKTQIVHTNQINVNITNDISQPGSTLNNALWEAKELLRDSDASEKRIILISDGDQEGSFLTEHLAALSVRDHNIQIYSVAIGYPPTEEYGHDQNGNRVKIPSNYREDVLRKVAQITGGQFIRVDRDSKVSSVVEKVSK